MISWKTAKRWEDYKKSPHFVWLWEKKEHKKNKINDSLASALLQ